MELFSKRFREVSEQRKTEERDFFRFWPSGNGTRAKIWTSGDGEGKEGNACRQTPRFWKPRLQVACEHQTYFLSSLLPPPKLGGREASSPANGGTASRTWMTFVDQSCFILSVRDTHINFLRLLFVAGPLMQEHFLWPLMKRKALLAVK